MNLKRKQRSVIRIRNKSKNLMSKKDKNKTQSEIVKSYYDVLDDGINTDTTEGFVAVFLFIEGDIKDIRMIGLN